MALMRWNYNNFSSRASVLIKKFISKCAISPSSQRLDGFFFSIAPKKDCSGLLVQEFIFEHRKKVFAKKMNERTKKIVTPLWHTYTFANSTFDFQTLSLSPFPAPRRIVRIEQICVSHQVPFQSIQPISNFSKNKWAAQRKKSWEEPARKQHEQKERVSVTLCNTNWFVRIWQNVSISAWIKQEAKEAKKQLLLSLFMISLATVSAYITHTAWAGEQQQQHKNHIPDVHNIYSSINSRAAAAAATPASTRANPFRLNRAFHLLALDCRGIFGICKCVCVDVVCDDDDSVHVMIYICCAGGAKLSFSVVHRGVTFLTDIEFNWQLFSIHKVVFCICIYIPNRSCFRSIRMDLFSRCAFLKSFSLLFSAVAAIRSDRIVLHVLNISTPTMAHTAREKKE